MIALSAFSDAHWARIARDWNAWWAGELKRPLIVLETYDHRPGIDWETFDDFITQFPLGTSPDQVLDHMAKRLEVTRYHGDAFPKYWVNLGAGIVAAFFGAGVEHGLRTTWFHPLTIDMLADLRPEYDPANPWWQWTQAITRAAVARWGRQVLVAHTDLGGNLDILASLRGTQTLLTDLYDTPDEVERLTRAITPLWLRYYDELLAIIQPAGRGTACWGPCWAPEPTYMLQCDFAYMIGPEMFRRYVMPDLRACCEHLAYPFYHLDGKGQLRHLDMLLSIPELRGIQWQPGDGQPMADHWLELLHRIRASGKLCQVYVTRQGAFTITRALGGRGFLFHIREPGLTAQEADDFMRAYWRSYSA
jgi:hypothetical protein